MHLTDSVEILHGVGKARAADFAAMGILTLRDLLWHFPRTYQDRGNVQSLSLTAAGTKASFLLTVGSEPRAVTVRRGMSLLKFRAFDDSGTVEITYFNQNYRKDSFAVGQTYRFFGRLEREKSRMMLSSPVAEVWKEEVSLPELYPVYGLSGGLSQRMVAECVRQAMSLCRCELIDPLPEDIRCRAGVCTLFCALEGIHMPQTAEDIRRAADRLGFDEIFSFTLGVASRAACRNRSGGRAFRRPDMAPFFRAVGFPLTASQSKTVGEILDDLCPGGDADRSASPMSRIVIGDVGSGKTVCAAAAVFAAAENGVQSALMAPTEILAEQHARDLTPLFASIGYTVVLLTGSLSAAERRRARDKIAGEGERRADLVIGTHALLSDGVDFADLGLVIADEQHRFGVGQRAALTKKGKNPHLLVMTATPIPRSLALVLYGDLDVSMITELPPGRQRVDTYVVDESYRDRLNRFIREQVGQGGQVYVVTPAVENTAAEEGELSLADLAAGCSAPAVKAAVDYAEELKNGALKGLSVAFLHGRMKAAEKNRVMEDFISGRIQVLVSTTVIEVGVNVPNACLMIVENAERFGLSQLHQLRGRVGRGRRKSYCVLICGGGGETARQRLDVMRKTNDGYRIAEEDLRLRGPGDFLPQGDSIRQHGELKFRFSSLGGGYSLYDCAVSSAKEIVNGDPDLSLPEHAALRDFVGGTAADAISVMN